MWQLHMTNEAREWGLVGRFETIGKAVGRITELEGSPRYGLFLRTYVDPLSSDDEALRDLEYKGQVAAYAIRRERRTH
jgi:hypothetical protein